MSDLSSMPERRLQAFLLVCCFLTPNALFHVAHARVIGLPGNLCENTQTGKYYIADNKGVFCPREELDSFTGCCRNGVSYSCETCGDDDCCGRYENCVSCCLAPTNGASEKYRDAFRIRGREESGKWTSVFHYCQGVCRTWSHSTTHENAFISTRRYCFSSFGRPQTTEEPLPPLPRSVTVYPGEAGMSCDDVCHALSSVCVEDAFDAIRSCNTLRSHFICEAGCGERKDDTRAEPYYVLENSEKGNLPAFCVQNRVRAATGEESRCGWKELVIRRLCPCAATRRLR